MNDSYVVISDERILNTIKRRLEDRIILLKNSVQTAATLNSRNQIEDIEGLASELILLFEYPGTVHITRDDLFNLQKVLSD